MHHFLYKMLCKYNYKYGYCPGHPYIGYVMLVQYQIVIFSCPYINTHSVYIVCHVNVKSSLSSNKILAHHGKQCWWSFFQASAVRSGHDIQSNCIKNRSTM